MAEKQHMNFLVRELGHYIVTKSIGEGGMGKVWRSWKISEGGFKKVLAIKTSKSSEKYIELFMNEAKISARFEHENIVKTFDFGKTDDEFFLVMEYVRGVNLKEFMSVVKHIPIDVFFYIVDRVLSGLIYIHNFEGRQLVHRDINQKNILISWNGNVKISDFGITLPQHGDFDPFGKLGYVPPEVILGKGWSQVGDIWCVGVLMWEILTAKKLFSGKSKDEIKKKILNSNITPPSHFNDSVSEEIDRIIMSSISKLPESRYVSAEKLQADLRQAISNSGTKPMYQEDFSAFIYEHFSEKIKEEEKELSEEEARLSIYMAEKNSRSNSRFETKDGTFETKNDLKKNNASFLHYPVPSESKSKVEPDLSDFERKTEGKTKKLGKRSSIKKNENRRERKIFFVSSILGFVLGLTIGIFKGAYDIKSAESLFRKGVDLAKEKNFHQAREFFQISADISDVREVKYIIDSINKNFEESN